MSGISYPYPTGIKQILKAGGSIGTLIQDIFSPLNIPGLTLWVDSGQLPGEPAKVILNGSKVARFIDFSGFGNHFDQATASTQPVYQANQQNGLATVSFNDTNAGFLTSVNDFISTAADTWFFVFQSDLNGADAHPTLFSDYVQQAANPIMLFRSENKGGTDVFYARDSSGRVLRVIPTLNSSYSLLIATRKTGSLVTDYNDVIKSAVGAYGPQIYSGGGPGFPTPALGSQAALGGGGTRNVGTQMKGHIAMVLRYSRELNAFEKNQVKTYSKLRWGL